MDTYLAERAANIGAFAARQTFGVSMREPARFNTELFELFSAVLNDAPFREEEITREKENQIADINNRDEKAISLAFSQLPSILYEGGHPYAYKSLGDAEMVEKYTKADMQAFWKKQLKQPWVLSVAGEFDEEEVLNFARSLPVPKDKAFEIDAPSFGAKKKLDLHLPERDQAHLVLAFPTVPMGHADAVALELLEVAIGGQSGALFTELRDKQGLGYTVVARNRISPKAGYMFFYIGTEPQKLEQAQKGFEEVIASLQNENIDAETIQSAKNRMESNYYRGRQTLGSRSGEAALLTTLGKDLKYSKEKLAKAQKLTAEDLRKVAKKYLNVNKAYTLTVAP